MPSVAPATLVVTSTYSMCLEVKPVEGDGVALVAGCRRSILLWLFKVASLLVQVLAAHIAQVQLAPGLQRIPTAQLVHLHMLNTRLGLCRHPCCVQYDQMQLIAMPCLLVSLQQMT